MSPVNPLRAFSIPHYMCSSAALIGHLSLLLSRTKETTTVIINLYMICHRYIITSTTWIRNVTFIFHVAQKICTSVYSTSCTLASVVIPNSNLYLNVIKCIQHYRVMSATVAWRPPQTTSRGSLSTFDTTTLTLSGRRTVNLSRNTDRKPRSLLLWSQRMTLVPFATASSTSWWDISPENRCK